MKAKFHILSLIGHFMFILVHRWMNHLCAKQATGRNIELTMNTNAAELEGGGSNLEWVTVRITRVTLSLCAALHMCRLVGEEYDAGSVTSHPPCLPVEPPLKRALYWINIGRRGRVGRSNLNRGEHGVSQLFQVKVEFGASVFVCNWVCLGLTLTSCEA